MMEHQQIIKVEAFIDTTDPKQVNALHGLLSAIGSCAEAPTADPAPADPKPEAPAAPAKTKGVAKTQSAKEDPKPAAPAAPAPEAPAAQAKEEPEPAPAAEIKIEEVREKLQEKVGEHREAIKAKLTELGAPNVSNLDPAKYPEFMDFLNGLP